MTVKSSVIHACPRYAHQLILRATLLVGTRCKM